MKMLSRTLLFIGASTVLAGAEGDCGSSEPNPIGPGNRPACRADGLVHVPRGGSAILDNVCDSGDVFSTVAWAVRFLSNPPWLEPTVVSGAIGIGAPATAIVGARATIHIDALPLTVSGSEPSFPIPIEVVVVDSSFGGFGAAIRATNSAGDAVPSEGVVQQGTRLQLAALSGPQRGSVSYTWQSSGDSNVDGSTDLVVETAPVTQEVTYVLKARDEGASLEAEASFTVRPGTLVPVISIAENYENRFLFTSVGTAPSIPTANLISFNWSVEFGGVPSGCDIDAAKTDTNALNACAAAASWDPLPSMTSTVDKLDAHLPSRGVYRVTLTVGDSMGAQGTSTKVIAFSGL